MKTKVYLGIAIRIILLFATGMLMTYMPPLMRDFFGDNLHVHTAKCVEHYSGCVNGRIDVLYEWGIRHYWYFWMNVLLFILTLINFIVSVINIINKNYK
jgi:hypothetical protein